MANTRPDITIQNGVDNDIYALLNAQVGQESVDIGDPLCIQNKSGFPIYIHQALSSQQGFTTGIRLESSETFYTDRGIVGCIATCSTQNGKLNVSIATSSPASLSSGRYNETRRVKTDPQPTSFEENRQFKIFHRLINVPNTTQVVFKFEAGTALNIMERKINLWAGGREYLVIPDTGQYDYLDALAKTDVPPTTVNGNLEDSGLPSHPVSQVTITRWDLTTVSGNQIVIADADQFPNGDAVQTDGNANRANNSLLSSPNLSGVASGQAFYLVFDSINNSATYGHFFLQWEEV